MTKSNSARISPEASSATGREPGPTLAWLLGEGRELLLKNDHRVDSTLNASQRTLLEQQRQWQKRSSSRIPEPEKWVWTDRSLSQASDWWSAVYKASLFPEGELVLDACCGAGVDAVALARRGPVIAVDFDPQMASLAQSNAGAHGFTIETHAESLSFASLRGARYMHVDPDRRTMERKTLDADQFSPPLADVLAIARRIDGAVIKIAPSTVFHPELLDALNGNAVRLWIGSRGECRQQLLLLGQPIIESALVHARSAPGSSLENQGVTPFPHVAVILEKSDVPDSDFDVHAFRGSPSDNSHQKEALGHYIYDLHATLFASHLHGRWAAQHGLTPVTDALGYYTGSAHLQSPWASTFEVIDVFAWDDRRVRKWLSNYGAGHVEVKNRLVKMNASEYQRRYSRDGGVPISLLVTRISSRVRCIACRRE